MPPRSSILNPAKDKLVLLEVLLLLGWLLFCNSGIWMNLYFSWSKDWKYKKIELIRENHNIIQSGSEAHKHSSEIRGLCLMKWPIEML